MPHAYRVGRGMKEVIILLKKPHQKKQKGRTLNAWLKESLSKHYTMVKDTEIDKGKEYILPFSSQKSFLDRALNRLSKIITQI
jgi:alpha-amylase/alpha-mannosidase (GH57 family)